MRIIGGEWRGRPIKAPQGRQATRPTTDRVREALASVVISRMGEVSGARVLDAFAGSGALGLEMLSRGAAHVTLCDQDRAALACIRSNVSSLGIGPDRVSVVGGDVFLSAGRGRIPGAPFDLVLLDPPYATPAERVADLLADLSRAGMAPRGCLVVYERSADADALPSRAPLTSLASKRYGSTCVDVLAFGARAGEGDQAPGRGTVAGADMVNTSEEV